MASYAPIFSDRYGGSILQLISLGLGFVILVTGAVQGNPLSVVLGLGLVVFIWFTRHFKYEIFSDRLVIHYGAPRKQVVLVDEISDVRRARVPMGGHALVLVRKGGRGMVIKPRDQEGFIEALAQVGVTAGGAGPESPQDLPHHQRRRRQRSRPHRPRRRPRN